MQRPVPLQPKPTIHRITLNRRQPAISIDDLIHMIEIEFVLGRRDDADSRIRRALNDAWRQGRSRN